jgi:hypothetical protein
MYCEAYRLKNSFAGVLITTHIIFILAKPISKVTPYKYRYKGRFVTLWKILRGVQT